MLIQKVLSRTALCGLNLVCRYKTTNKSHCKMKVLNVAEKNDAAKHIAGYLSGGNLRRRNGYSKYNMIYEFTYTVFGKTCDMIMTSVSGHLLELDFVGAYRGWRSCNIIDLFSAPVTKQCASDYEPIKRTLEREVRSCEALIIWTDCDREGENIGFEIIQVCTAVRRNIQVYRATFSEITAQSVHRAISRLGQPDKNISDAVDIRQELDLRIGAAFTRFQTLRLQKVFPQHLSEHLISYGSCQFPTLGFVVERYKAIEGFVPEPFWKIKVNHTINDLSIDFTWKRVRLFDRLACQVLYDICVERPQARVVNVQSKPKSKWRPLPLDTVELEKSASRKLKINAKETMKIAEKLYTQGFISYPRTETNMFPEGLNLRGLVELQTEDRGWGEFASRVLQDGPNPRAGNKSDQAHPPIHPTKYAPALQGNEKILYEFIVRHFLACCSKDAEGLETIVEIEIAGEEFVAHGLMIIARNYLDVYPYEKWNSKEIHVYQIGQIFEPTNINMVDGSTSAPNLLTEADLIALMEKHGIGTDATHADHIETIKTRMYAGLDDLYFVPGKLGMGLVEGYDNMGFAMSKPNLRAELEADLKRICQGTKDPKLVLREQLAKYEEVFRLALDQAVKIDEALGRYLQEQANQVPLEEMQPTIVLEPVYKCPSCGLDMVIKTKRDNSSKYISCIGFPDCRHAVWFPSDVEDVTLSSETCPECGPAFRKMNFTFHRGSMMPYFPDQHTGCIGGCDLQLLNVLNISLNAVQGHRVNNNNSNNNIANASRYVGGGHNNNPADNSRGHTSRSSASDSGYQGLGSSGSNSSSWNSGSNHLPSRRVPGGQHSFQGSQQDGSSSFADEDEGFGGGNRQSRGGTSIRGRGRGSSIWGRGGGTSIRGRGIAVGSSLNRLNSGTSRTTQNEQENVIMCNCNQEAVLLTVKKAGPNTGRKFYKCNQSSSQGCNFFLWGDGEGVNRSRETVSSTVTTNYSNNSRPPPVQTPAGGYPNEGDGEVRCTCGVLAKRLTVHKEGPNTGRQFYACSKPQGDRCNFFKWADDVDRARDGGDWGGGDDYGGGRHPRPGGSTRGQGPATHSFSSNTERKKRKCGICGMEGHNRKNCPNNRP